MVQVTNRGRSRTVFPRAFCKGQWPKRSTSTTFSLCVDRDCLRDVSPSEAEKMHFWNSIFDAFARTFINLWPLKRGYLRRSSLPLRSWKKCNFQIQFAQFGAYLLPTFYWKTNIHFQWNIGYFYVCSSHLSCFDAFVRTKTFDHWKYGDVWGATRSQKLRKMQISNSICKIWVHIFCQHFTENPLFFSNEILAFILCLFFPLFHFSFMIRY